MNLFEKFLGVVICFHLLRLEDLPAWVVIADFYFFGGFACQKRRTEQPFSRCVKEQWSYGGDWLTSDRGAVTKWVVFGTEERDDSIPVRVTSSCAVYVGQPRR